eukprot:CAMPEP_0201575068 /NCGR_PEP_ID=MMETSP0190_2-20130828/20014_1 /ASSEMBLY_ACC=CAM_ASM_000263 /TAXON_ID=37353 /ORGANISM="Rosalina sp." /LENGTH=284 /DNA_ID=CAMNT_0048004221 /DNA_START=382 /DNA_END=1236 /DNA_ORIENTATION=+
MSRRVILMKLQKAQDDGSFIEQLSIAWKLNDKPSIDDIVMVYDVDGEHVIQRATSEPNLSVEGQRNLEILTIQKQREEAIQAQKQKEEEAIQALKQKEEAIRAQKEKRTKTKRKRMAHHRKLSTNPFDQFPDIKELGVREINHERRMSTNPFDEYCIEDIDDINNIPSDSDDTVCNPNRGGHIPTITEDEIPPMVQFVNLNSENKPSTVNKVPRRYNRQSSKVHIPDQSFVSLDMAFDIDGEHNGSMGMNGLVSLDMAFDDDDNGALRLQRITSASSMKSVVSL